MTRCAIPYRLGTPEEFREEWVTGIYWLSGKGYIPGILHEIYNTRIMDLIFPRYDIAEHEVNIKNQRRITK